MKIIEHNVIIPAVEEKVIKNNIYIADDGTKFEGYEAEEKCIKYEERCKLIKSIEHIPHENTYSLDDENRDSFYIKNKEEFDLVLNYKENMGRWYTPDYLRENGFKGEDWYSFWVVENSYTSNDYCIETLSEAKQNINKFLEQFQI